MNIRAESHTPTPRTRSAAAPTEGDAEMRDLLADCHTIAVVGIKEDPREDAYRIPAYMQKHGYRIVPVSPKVEGKQVLGETGVASLGDLAGPVDLVNLFRASDNIPHHTDEILAMDPLPKGVWMQLGIHHGAAAARLREAGIRVVQDRCLMVDHRRLLSDD